LCDENDDCCPYCFGRKVLPGYNSFDVTQPILSSRMGLQKYYSII